VDPSTSVKRKVTVRAGRFFKSGLHRHKRPLALGPTFGGERPLSSM
jgi:hypothetical protein